ncbi:alpha/beta fold hydrolase [Bradyrhizobium ivorense]|uniref:alpha/beta fold hydrolase n=1 Tax=Bradyrhizobium ivorense TaxID=2511166 RepID=UPI001E3D2857|nr:alpha/beta fold hydrolase [Bradyrhizobium ivorense]
MSIAYQVMGDGPIDIVLVPGWISNIEVFWEEPIVARFLREIASFARLILFDKRGTGLSDRHIGVATLEQRMDDVRAVMDAVGSKRAVLMGYSEGGPLCALFSATYPERTSALIMINSYARITRAEDYPWGPTERELTAFLDRVANDWGGPLDIEQRIPTMANDSRFARWWARFLRMGATPKTLLGLAHANRQIDIRHVLPSVRVPALILHADADRIIEPGHGRYLAGAVSGAKPVIYPARDHLPFAEGAQHVIRHVREFLTGAYQPASVDSTPCTILFTDIVGSTRQVVERGDRAWADLLAAHNDAVRSELAVYRGREVNNTGDGFVAIFDGPARSGARRPFATRFGRLASTCGWGCIPANANFRMDPSPALPCTSRHGFRRPRKQATSSFRAR